MTAKERAAKIEVYREIDAELRTLPAQRLRRNLRARCYRRIKELELEQEASTAGRGRG